MIDIVFSDDKDVRDAWADLYNLVISGVGSTREGAIMIGDRQEKLFRVMAKSIGFDAKLTPADYIRIFVSGTEAAKHKILEAQFEAARVAQSAGAASAKAATPPNNDGDVS